MKPLMLNCRKCQKETKYVMHISKQEVRTGASYTVKGYCSDCGETINWIEYIRESHYQSVADL
ncbi:hypothetical protein JOD45_003085 [Scopulibacillus daqui]|uniref:SR1 protein n=1 Tax=Scopulibacillus daqui TaxID=1469162 RepID=A0ABS2Q404_9BACL|nr:hypothetical protein [Scopulibacillus daqui]MBM7646851.1 hypothetical protein [Scopulibacillus daqui]